MFGIIQTSNCWYEELQYTQQLPIIKQYASVKNFFINDTLWDAFIFSKVFPQDTDTSLFQFSTKKFRLIWSVLIHREYCRLAQKLFLLNLLQNFPSNSIISRNILEDHIVNLAKIRKLQLTYIATWLSYPHQFPKICVKTIIRNLSNALLINPNTFKFSQIYLLPL